MACTRKTSRTAAADITEAKRHNIYVVTTYGARTEYTLRYIKRHPYETTVGPVFTSKQALRKFANKHDITITHWS